MEDLEKLEQKVRKEFGKKLVKLIERKRKIKSEVARELKVPYTTMSDWCNGKAYPKIKSMLILADYFNIPYDDLVATDTKKNKDFFAKDFKLCYVDGQKAFFTNNFEKQWRR